MKPIRASHISVLPSGSHGSFTGENTPQARVVEPVLEQNPSELILGSDLLGLAPAIPGAGESQFAEGMDVIQMQLGLQIDENPFLPAAVQMIRGQGQRPPRRKLLRPVCAHPGRAGGP